MWVSSLSGLEKINDGQRKVGKVFSLSLALNDCDEVSVYFVWRRVKRREGLVTV